MQYCNIMQTDMECKSNEAKHKRRKVSAGGLVIVFHYFQQYCSFPFSMTSLHFLPFLYGFAFCPFPLGEFSGMAFEAVWIKFYIAIAFHRISQRFFFRNIIKSQSVWIFFLFVLFLFVAFMNIYEFINL